MVSGRVLLAAVFLCMLAMPPVLHGQTGADIPRSSLGIRAGYSWPFGDWAKSPAVPSVNLFDPTFAFEADLDFAIADRWTVGIEGGYSALNGNGWEEYALEKGDTVDVSGSFIHFCVLIRPHIKVTRPDLIRLEIGPALLLASGEESFGGRTYTYDFLDELSFGVQGGAEYIRLLGDDVALSLKVTGLYFFSAAEHLGGTSDAVIFLQATVGIRFYL